MTSFFTPDERALIEEGHRYRMLSQEDIAFIRATLRDKFNAAFPGKNQ